MACQLVEELLNNIYKEYAVFCQRMGRLPPEDLQVKCIESIPSNKEPAFKTEPIYKEQGYKEPLYKEQQGYKEQPMYKEPIYMQQQQNDVKPYSPLLQTNQPTQYIPQEQECKPAFSSFLTPSD